MVPLEESFSGFHRLVRDLGSQLGKEIDLVIAGANTEMDKNIIEALKDPLVHIIRNSADHGIEAPELRAKLGKPRAGTIRIEARQQGSKVEIAISDDGAGLDIERIKAKGVERGLIDATERDPKRIMPLIFEPSFSTAARTTGVSGRGVGMDVVKSNLERLRGEISLDSEPGRGTRILLCRYRAPSSSSTASSYGSARLRTCWRSTRSRNASTWSAPRCSATASAASSTCAARPSR